MSQQSFSTSHKLVSFGRIAVEAILTTTAFSALVYFLPALSGDRALAVEVETEETPIEDVQTIQSLESVSTSADDLRSDRSDGALVPSYGGESGGGSPDNVEPRLELPEDYQLTVFEESDRLFPNPSDPLEDRIEIRIEL
ncbi:MAG: hypothetical protein ACFE0I_18975 [Elainellaceae cyanobacterium]